MNKLLYRRAVGLVLPLLIFAGLYYPLLGYGILACMFIAIIISFYNGRYWCGRLCPRGLFFDEFLNVISSKNKIPAFFKSLPFKLIWLVILMAVMAIQFVLSKGNVYLFGRGLLMILIVTTVIGILLGIYYKARAWCIFCPIGTMCGWLGRNRKPINIEGENCINCNICLNNCPMDIHAGEYKNLGRVVVGDCTKCGKCVSVCPQKALSL